MTKPTPNSLLRQRTIDDMGCPSPAAGHKTRLHSWLPQVRSFTEPFPRDGQG